jgi:hypothetical protein
MKKERAVADDVGNKRQRTGPSGQAGRARSDLVDRRAGAYDRVTKKPAHPMKEHRDPHLDGQWQSAVQPETEPSGESVPEGLRREQKHPLNPHTGRDEKPDHVPEWKPKS